LSLLDTSRQVKDNVHSVVNGLLLTLLSRVAVIFVLPFIAWLLLGALNKIDNNSKQLNNVSFNIFTVKYRLSSIENQLGIDSPEFDPEIGPYRSY